MPLKSKAYIHITIQILSLNQNENDLKSVLFISIFFFAILSYFRNAL